LDNPPPGIILRNESLLVKQLKLHGGILSSGELNIIPSLQSLGTIERQSLEKLGAELYIPIKIGEGELSGMLILGKKLSGQDYSNEERQLLLTLANQMGMALENARLYDLERTTLSELQKQNEQKTEFLHGVAHELKTPLTAIISSSELLSEGSSIAYGLRKKLIHNIRKSAESMNRRVAELLDLATMQIGELKIEPEPLEMTHIITEVASQLRVLFKSKKQTLTLEMPDSLPKVKADRGKLEQVLFNLLSNANKFSPTGKDVILRAKQADEKIIVEIEDSAPAVTEDDKRRLFDPYYRGDDPEKRERFAGLGLGLSISRKLVELHQGDIWVENKPTKGNIFAFSLPVLGRRKSGAK
jgi:signal transduction histidine kinase